MWNNHQINTIVLAAVFLQFYRTKTKRLRRSSVGIAAKTAINYAERRKTVMLVLHCLIMTCWFNFWCRDLVKGITVLLPLLGITWIVGLFAMNRGTLVFAWIFTFLNCFQVWWCYIITNHFMSFNQGVFIFVFHVVYTQKVNISLISMNSVLVCTSVFTNESCYIRLSF